MTQKIKKGNTTTLYKDIASDIISKIKNMTYQHGALLPPEKDLMECYDASRDTVRKSLALLSNRGFIEKKQGLGCMVKQPRLTNFLLKFDLNQYKETSRKITIEYCTYDTVLKALKVQPGTPVIRIERTLYEDKKPVMLDIKYMPFKKGTPFIEEEIQYAEFSNLGLIDISPFTLKCDMDISVELIEHDHLSQILCSKLGEPILIVNRTITDDQGTVYSYESTMIRKGLHMLHAFSGYVLENE